jgi:hypothetical protein
VQQETLSLRVLAERVFLNPYAIQGIRSAIARESRCFLLEEALAKHLTRTRRGILVAELADHLPGFARLAQALPATAARAGSLRLTGTVPNRRSRRENSRTASARSTAEKSGHMRSVKTSSA